MSNPNHTGWFRWNSTYKYPEGYYWIAPSFIKDNSETRMAYYRPPIVYNNKDPLAAREYISDGDRTCTGSDLHQLRNIYRFYGPVAPPPSEVTDGS